MVYHGEVVLSHAQGVKGANLDAGTHPDTADSAELASAIEHDGSAAVGCPIIGKDRIGLTHTVDATAQCKIGFFFFDLLTQNRSHGLGCFKSAYDTNVTFDPSRRHGLCGRAASRLAASSAVGSRKTVRNGEHFGVFPHIEYARSDPQADTGC